ncbi:MAG: asparagine synthase (glutamine-hydrolyzing) [Bacteroidales bacterium]|nr:asparagine synthase (glutamine-hydrolyzing) [Bacteroidales bacterium]
MCGIAGVLALTENGKSLFPFLPAAIQKLHLRGPDRNKIHESGDFAGAHARLSIIDLSEASDQPFISDDGRYILLLNGEIFNFREIRAELEGQGRSFKTTGDVEVGLQAFIQYGPACLDKLNGFFAIAVYDTHEKSLFLARDRYGIKPLYYFQDAQSLIFASEMKALLEFPIKRELNQASFRDYFQFTYIPEPFTMLKGIQKLPAAHYAMIREGKMELKQWYEIPEGKYEGSYEDAQKDLRELMEDSIAKRMISDVPLGAFLSGGIDSSIVSVLAARQNSKMEVFSITFPDHPYYDESVYAKEVAQMHGLNHQLIPVREKDFLDALPKVLDYLDEPFADSSAIAVHVLSEFVRKHLTVALSGDAADEIFGGYRKQRAAAAIMGSSAAKRALLKSLRHIPGNYSRKSKAGDLMRKMQRMGKAASLNGNDLYVFLASFMAEEEKTKIFSPNIQSYGNSLQHLLGTVSVDDFNTFLRADMKMVLNGDMLRKTDLMSMANSLELRSPFLDYRIINFAFSLQSNWKVDKKTGKRILLDAFQDIIPPSVLKRPKHGFEVPLGSWIQGDLLNELENSWLNNSFIRSQGLFNPEYIGYLLSQVRIGKASVYQSTIWSLIVFQNWWKKYMA